MSPPAPSHLTLFKFDGCPYCRRVMKVIDELGLEVELRDTRQDPEAYGELIEVGGKRQVPCLFIDREPLYESADIIDYLKSLPT